MLTPNQQKLIDQYIVLLKEYNEKVNVYSKSAYDKLPFHIQDCLNLAELIGNKPIKVVDMGSGSGLPSVILAIANNQNTIMAVESKAKKCEFLRHIQSELKLDKYRVINMDINEFIHQKAGQGQYYTAKAFGSFEKVEGILTRGKIKNAQLFIPISGQQYQELDAVANKKYVLIKHQLDGFFYVRSGL